MPHLPDCTHGSPCSAPQAAQCRLPRSPTSGYGHSSCVATGGYSWRPHSHSPRCTDCSLHSRQVGRGCSTYCVSPDELVTAALRQPAALQRWLVDKSTSEAATSLRAPCEEAHPALPRPPFGAWQLAGAMEDGGGKGGCTVFVRNLPLTVTSEKVGSAVT